MLEKKYITNVDEITSIRCDADSREITLNKGFGENWSVYVSDNTMLTKLKRLMKTAPEGYVKCWASGKTPDGFASGYFFELNPKCVTFRSGKKKERNIKLTEEQKAERKAKFVERTRKAREAKKKLKESK